MTTRTITLKHDYTPKQKTNRPSLVQPPSNKNQNVYSFDIITSRTRKSHEFFFFSSRRRHTRCSRDWSSDVCSSDLFRGTAIPHQALLFEDAEKAFALQEEFVRLGFRPTAELALAKVGLPDCIVNTDLEVRPAAEGAALDAFRAISAAIDAGSGHSRDVIDQLWGLWRERYHRVGMQAYVAYLNGAAAGTISVWPRGIFAWI